jgi:mono/diheme cytochrome c family protein
MKPFQGSGRLVFMIMGVLAFGTVLLGGVARESSRPRFVNRYSHYDKLYVPEERQPVLMVDLEAPVAEAPAAPPAPARQAAAELIATRCTACHGLDQVRSYTRGNWRQVVDNMIAYGASLSEEEARLVVEHLEAGLPY